jgi:hypothetical protein
MREVTMFGLGYQELLLILIFVGIPIAIIFAVKKFSRRRNGDEDELVGIGGWLVLVAIGVCITPFILGWQMWQAILTNDWSGMNAVQIGVGGAAMGAFAAIAVGWAVYNAVLFFRRRRIFPRSWIALNCLILIVAIIGVVFDPKEAAGLGGVIFWTVVWGVYLLRSRRAKATFVL